MAACAPGRDVAIGALLGADEFGFATAPLIASGCIMMRKCHLNTCPVGVATQDPVLRKRFTGQPEHVINYFFFVAEELREIMARLGFRTVTEMIGPRRPARHDARRPTTGRRKGVDLVAAPASGAAQARRRHLQLRDAEPRSGDGARSRPDRGRAARHRKRPAGAAGARRSATSTARSAPCCRAKSPSVTAMPACRKTRSSIRFTGTAGQSFGAFLARGVSLELIGDANDYVGKGLSGGRIVVRQPKASRREPTENIIVGNTVLYGAIAGEAYFEGVAGERFAVRNSGAVAVVEGTGDHGCEYMTGGVVVVLGKTGRNFAAGMSGGIAYVYDPRRRVRDAAATWRWSSWRRSASTPPAAKTRRCRASVRVSVSDSGMGDPLALRCANACAS